MRVFKKYILRFESRVHSLRKLLDIWNNSIRCHVFEIFDEFAFLLLHAHHYRYCE
jgi:hypothetical protein